MIRTPDIPEFGRIVSWVIHHRATPYTVEDLLIMKQDEKDNFPDKYIDMILKPYIGPCYNPENLPTICYLDLRKEHVEVIKFVSIMKHDRNINSNWNIVAHRMLNIIIEIERRKRRIKTLENDRRNYIRDLQYEYIQSIDDS